MTEKSPPDAPPYCAVCPYIILDLIWDKAITLDDFEGFSDGLKERLDDLIEFWNR